MLTNPGATEEVKAAGDGEELDVEGEGQVKEQEGGALHCWVAS